MPFWVGFLRGSMDSDGCYRKKEISFASVSYFLIEDICFGLDLIGLGYSVKKYTDKRPNRVPVYHVVISSEEKAKFVDIIKPRNKKF